jgi:hypothetical protein
MFIILKLLRAQGTGLGGRITRQSAYGIEQNSYFKDLRKFVIFLLNVIKPG